MPNNLSHTIISTGLNTIGLGFIASPLENVISDVFGTSEKHKRYNKNKKHFFSEVYPYYKNKYSVDYSNLPKDLQGLIVSDLASKKYPKKTVELLDNYFNSLPSSQTKVNSFYKDFGYNLSSENFFPENSETENSDFQKLLPKVDVGLNLNSIIYVVAGVVLIFLISKK